MAGLVKHRFTSGKTDDPDTTLVQASDWNDSLVVSAGSNGQYMVRDSAQADGWKLFSGPVIDVTGPGFNATGDGTTNDYTAINAAVASIPAAGGILFFPPGTYRTNTTILIPSNTLVMGASQGGSIIKAGSSLGDTSVFRNSVYNAANDGARNVNIGFMNLTIDGNKSGGFAATEQSHGILLQALKWGFVQNVTCQYLQGDGVYVGHAQGVTTVLSENVKVSNNLFYLCYRNGVSITGGSRILVHGNTSSSCGLCGIDLETNGSLTPNIDQCTVTSNQVVGCGTAYPATGGGIFITDALGTTQNVIVANNIVESQEGYGIAFRGVVDLIIDNNIIHSCDNIGINLVSGAAVSPVRVKITNNFLLDVGTYGISYANANPIYIAGNHITGASASGIQCDLSVGSHIINNTILSAGANGIFCQGATYSVINGNICRTSTENGIRLSVSGATNCTHNVVTGNSCVDNTNRGIHETTGGDNNIIQGNMVTGNGTAIITVGTSTKVRNNNGYVTEASGTATIASGATTAVVTHGLSVTPTLDDITIVFGEQGTADYGRWSVGTLTSTQFTLTVAADPGASNLDFAWRAVAL